jgi:hypothetical protein
MPLLPTILITLGFTILFSVIIIYGRFFKNSGLSSKILILIFLLKVAASILYGEIHLHNYGECDTFRMFKSGNIIFNSLSEDPRIYFRLTFGANGVQPPDYAKQTVDELFYWPNTPSYTLVRFHALARLVSFGIYQVHAVIFAFLTFIALLALYRMFRQLFPNKRKMIFLAVFLIPSTVYYGSGLHKEGLVVIAMSLILFNLYKLTGHKKILPAFLALFSGAILLYLVREFYFAALIAPMLAYLIIQKWPGRLLLKYATVFLLFWMALFMAYKIIPGFNLSKAMADKQSEFRVLKGNSNVDLPVMEPEIISILKILPKSFQNTFLRPGPGEMKNMGLFLYGMENYAVLLFLLLTLVFMDKNAFRKPMPLFLIIFAVSATLVIGTIVPNLGAISRYKSPAVLFLVLGCILILDEKILLKSIKSIPLNFHKSD